MKPSATNRRLILRRRRSQRGFALLLVFLMASAVALMLYMQLPREAFESERAKEQLLIDRGEQYKRAIYLYYVSNNRQWPSKLEDLESTNGHRYLRERFADPYTGKADWRLIHTNGAYLTDSLVTPPPAQGAPGGPGTPGAPGGPGGSVVPGGALAGTGAATPSSGFTLTSPLTAEAGEPNAPPQVNAQVQRRASDLTMVQNSSYQNIAGGAPAAPANSDPGYQPFNPAALPPISLYPNGYNAPPAGATQPGVNQLGVNQPGVNQPGFNPAGINQPGVNPSGINVAPNSNQLGGPNPIAPNQNGLNQPTVNPFSAGNPFVNPNGLNPQGNPGGAGQSGIAQTGGVTPGAPSPVNLPGTNFPMTNQGFIPPNLSTSNFNQPTTVASQPNQNQFGQPNPFPPQQFPSGNVGAPPGVQGFGGGAPGANNQAMTLINNLLTQPRQPPAGIGPAGQQPTNGGGLAGVASTYKGATIKEYGDRTKYQEWEFVFQLNQLNPQGAGTTLQQPQGPNGSGGIPNGGILGAGPAAPGSSNGSSNAPGTPGGTSPFPGSSPGIGGATSSPFGTSGIGTGGFGATPTH